MPLLKGYFNKANKSPTRTRNNPVKRFLQLFLVQGASSYC